MLEWRVALFVTALLLACAEAGHRLGRRLFEKPDEARKSQAGAVQGALLGLLGLLLAFTYSMAIARYDTRRDLVVKEANAIGTTWLRASLLPDVHRKPVRDLLRTYVDVRLRTRESALDSSEMLAGLRQSAQIQSELWIHADAAAREAPSPITATFITTLNEMIDTDAERVWAARNRIPSGVWLILFVVAAASTGFVTYTAAGSARSLSTSVLLPLLFSLMIVVIYDLTHERQGLIGIGQQPLIDLRDSMRSEPPNTPPPSSGR